MLTTFIILAAAALAPGTSKSAAICAVGRVALRDLPAADRGDAVDSYYAGMNGHHDLLDLCPKLKSELPFGYVMATEDAFARAAMHAPVPGYQPRPAFIYTINPPRFSADMKYATVRFQYLCTGLCGGAFEAHYVLSPGGWYRQGEVRTLRVS